jgi:hypothetical protein
LVTTASPARAALVAGPVLVVIAAGLWLRFQGPPRERALHLLLTAVTVPLAVLPSLLVRENDVDVRLLSPLDTLILLLLVIAGSTLVARAVGPRRHRLVTAGLLGLMLIAATLSARTILSENFIRPGTTLDAFLRRELAQISERPSEVDVFIPASGWSDFPNLGLLSQRSDLEGDLNGSYVSSSAIRLILVEQRHPWARDVHIGLVPQPTAAAPGAVVLDTTPVQRALVRR